MKPRRRRRTEKEELVKKVIWPAIRGNSCPICLSDLESRYKEASVLSPCYHAYCTHCILRWSHVRTTCPLCNSDFKSWFCNLSLSSRTFRNHFLPFRSKSQSQSQSQSHSQSQGFNSDANHRSIPTSYFVGRTRVSSNNQPSRTLPWRRSFATPDSPDVIAQRKLEWRASIYNRGLQADPASLREPRCKGCGPCNLLISYGKSLSGNEARKGPIKKEIFQRIDPWIRRELQAILGDPDPTVIVYVVTSQFIAWLEEKAELPSRQLDVRDSFLLPLRSFLHDKAGIFWHELSCFALGCYSMGTYDEVIEYKYQDRSE